MTGVERREKLLSMLAKSKEPIAGAGGDGEATQCE